ncbi:MAG: cell-cell signaling protein [Alcanivoracaceae bacterium]|nr:cell-cell signaling protein [Alcanivoracaceae bacterium]
MSAITPSPITRLITGASSGIGLALVRYWLSQGSPVIAVSRRASHCLALLQLQSEHRTGGGALRIHDADITDEQQLEDLATCLRNDNQIPDHIIQCAGVLHDPAQSLTPEKRLEDISLQALQRSFAINAFGPILLARTLLPLLDGKRRSVFASLSARVGSIQDNHLGGWYSYRASKAAQNQLLRTLAIETRRRLPNLTVLALHPGTTDTPLSRPYQRNVPEGKLFSAERSAHQLAAIIDNAGENDHGRFVAWDGSDIPW